MKKTILLSGLALVAAQTAHAQSGEDKSFDGFKVGASAGRTSQDVDRKITGETASVIVGPGSVVNAAISSEFRALRASPSDRVARCARAGSSAWIFR